MILQFNIISYTLWAKFQRPEKDYSINEGSLITLKLYHILRNHASSQSVLSRKNLIEFKMWALLLRMLSASKIMIKDQENLQWWVEHNGAIWVSLKRMFNPCSKLKTLKFMRWVGLPHSLHNLKIIGIRVVTLSLLHMLLTAVLSTKANLSSLWCLYQTESITLLSNPENVWNNGHKVS